jgi:DNA topoisomerase-1
MFKLPRTIGEYEGAEMTVAIGRFGPYVRHANKFYSLAKTDDPMTIEAERAIELILDKKQKDKEKTIKVFDEDKSVQVLNGRYGAYIKKGKNNYRIPKGTDAKELTLEDCNKIIEAADKKKGGKKK